MLIRHSAAASIRGAICYTCRVGMLWLREHRRKHHRLALKTQRGAIRLRSFLNLLVCDCSWFALQREHDYHRWPLATKVTPTVRRSEPKRSQLSAHRLALALPRRSQQSSRSARDGRAYRNLADFEVGFVFANDLGRGHYFVVEVFGFDGCAEHNFAVGVDRRGIDDLRVTELALDFLNMALDEGLHLFRRVVLGVFADVALQARLADRARGFDAADRF